MEAHLTSGDAIARLRLAGVEAEAPPRPAAVARARREVAAENFMSSALAADDARTVFAMRVAVALDGGRAAILRPERRRALIAGATRMGLRQFDANLVIAIVQDAARRGEPVDNPDVTDRLCMLHPAGSGEVPVVWLAGLAGLLAGAILMAMVAWVVNGR